MDMPKTTAERKPYWNDSCKMLSTYLQIPDLSANTSVETGSWFTINGYNRCDRQDSLTESSSEIGGDGLLIRAKRIRVYPTEKQKVVIKHWFGSSRFTYNQTIEHLRQDGTIASYFSLRDPIIGNLPDWAKSSPAVVKRGAVKDACLSVKAAKEKFLLTGNFQEVKFRSRKSNQCVVLPKSTVCEEGIYVKKLGKMLAAEKIPKAEHDCRLVLQRDRYFLIVPIDVKKQVSESQAGVVALDPGLRTFLTSYDGNRVEKIGTAAFSRIVRLCHALDVLTRDQDKATGTRKRRMKKAQNRLRNRVADSISELHHKVAAKLTSEYKVIIISKFNFHSMAQSLFRKTVRGLATLAHGRFRKILASHAEKRGCKIVFQNEAYTSKTCSCCGHLQEIGSRSSWKCKSCSHKHDRDANGARGIFLRALVDTPWIQQYVSSIPS